MNLRKEKFVARCSDDKGVRQFRLHVGIEVYESINKAKKANGLNAATCDRFPPCVDELHEEALAMNAEPLAA